ncbi:MAG: iron ABC transporter permease [Solirubrobacteraceae bacterium]|nr:iron ABC transporter permease [Solirubrobacteraceae bacterium]
MPSTVTSPLSAAPSSAPSSARRSISTLASLAVLCATIVASVAVGSKDLPLDEVWRALAEPDGSDATAIVRDLRVPRTLLGLLVGAALGAAGALMQGITRNPLAEPGILGINAGASLAVVIAISVLGLGEPSAFVPFALVGAGLTALLVFALGGSGRGGPTPIRLALAGAVLMTLLISLTSAILVFSARTLDEFRFWLVGSIAGRDASITYAVAPFLVAGLVAAVACGRGLNALALGDDIAKGLGQRVVRTRVTAGLASVVLSGIAVAVAGPVAFVGLAVPHIARALCGPDYRWIIPLSLVLGAALLLGADTFGRVVARPAELQVGIATALLGAPFFVWLVRRGQMGAV